MLGAILVPIVILIIVGAVILATMYIVPQQRAYVIERLGKFNRISHPGFHVRIPFIEQIAGKVDLRTCQAVLMIDAKTKDNVTVQMEIAVQYCVDTSGAVQPNGSMNPRHGGIYRAFYILSDAEAQMKSYIADSLRSSVPKYSIDEVYDKKDEIAEDVKGTIGNAMVQYGYIVVSTLITNIKLPADVQDAMNEINTAQRKKEAAQSLADANKIQLVTEATAQAEAARQVGIGIANQRKAIAEGINASLESIRQSGVSVQEANLLFMYTQWADMMGEFARSGNASTVVLPSDFGESQSMFAQILAAKEVK